MRTVCAIGDKFALPDIEEEEEGLTHLGQSLAEENFRAVWIGLEVRAFQFCLLSDLSMLVWAFHLHGISFFVEHPIPHSLHCLMQSGRPGFEEEEDLELDDTFVRDFHFGGFVPKERGMPEGGDKEGKPERPKTKKEVCSSSKCPCLMQGHRNCLSCHTDNEQCGYGALGYFEEGRCFHR
jgi:hypothetical protein